jgi:peptidoglycan/xylan/chitin deacetylase (PgdA/CDA1 family)
VVRSISLLYHDVVAPGRYGDSGFQSADANLYKLDEPLFVAHLDAIAARTRPERRLFTFDDAGASAVRIGELLANRGWHGYFFVPTDFIGTPAFLDAPQIRSLARQGHTIGSHSCSHPLRMAALSRPELVHEWRQSRTVLEEIVDGEVHAASIPGGYYSQVVAEAAAEAGFRELFTSEPVAEPWRVGGVRVFGRYSVQRAAAAEVVASIAAGDLQPRVRQYVYWNLKKILKRAGGSHWIDFRRAVLRRFARSR